MKRDRPLESIRRTLGDPLLIVALIGGTLFAALLVRPHADTDAGRRVLSVGILQPLVEEILFRGVLQVLLRRTAWGRASRLGISAANLVTSITFAAVHLVHYDASWAIGVLAPSLLFGYFRDRHDGIVSPVILHVAFNLALVL